MQKVKHEIEKQADKRRNSDERRPKTLKIHFFKPVIFSRKITIYLAQRFRAS